MSGMFPRRSPCAGAALAGDRKLVRRYTQVCSSMLDALAAALGGLALRHSARGCMAGIFDPNAGTREMSGHDTGADE